MGTGATPGSWEQRPDVELECASAHSYEYRLVPRSALCGVVPLVFNRASGSPRPRSRGASLPTPTLLTTFEEGPACKVQIKRDTVQIGGHYTQFAWGLYY